MTNNKATDQQKEELYQLCVDWFASDPNDVYWALCAHWSDNWDAQKTQAEIEDIKQSNDDSN